MDIRRSGHCPACGRLVTLNAFDAPEDAREALYAIGRGPASLPTDNLNASDDKHETRRA